MSVAAKPRTAPRPDRVAVKTALLSVFDKTGLIDFARALAQQDVKILSTGGTARALQDAGIAVTEVSDHTGFPEIMDGRVKTLHPKIHGGLLARRDDADHLRAMNDQSIESIDLLLVNLYPFRDVVSRGGDYDSCVENIDIGGPAMLRAAAKNHDFVAVVTDPSDYDSVLAEIAEGGTTLATRQKLAGKTYAMTAAYDSMIANWFAQQNHDEFPATLNFSARKIDTLRYGENPHQSAAVYSDSTARAGVVTAQQLQGKELSYNNLNDTDAAFELVCEFDEPAVAIIKHANPCGVAIDPTCNPTSREADMRATYLAALACDPVSAFGGIIALNRELDADTAAEIIKIFSEVIIAPRISPGAREILSNKKNLRVLETHGLADPRAARKMIKSIAGGVLVQDADCGHITREQLRVVTKRAPSDTELNDLLFAFKVCKHVKSNAIIYAEGGRTLGIGAGQMSRVDSCRIAAWKMKEIGAQSNGAAPHHTSMVVASDAFFPFADGLLAAIDAGATAVIQPGGSMRDEEVIKAADDAGIAMVMTDMRHFRH